MKRTAVYSCLLSTSVVTLIGCNASDSSTGAQSQDPSLRLSDRQIVELFGSTVCDPMDEGEVVPQDNAYRQGLRAEVTVPPAGFRTDVSVWRNLDRYEQADAITLEHSIFVNSIDVPTRAFSSGFPTLLGDLIQDPSGAVLEEWFRLDFEGYLKPTWQLGQFRSKDFALLVDDGARLKLGNQFDVIAEFTGVQSTQMVCGTAPVSLRGGELVPIQLEYFQGPKWHIALQLLWRDASATPDPLCGQNGNSRFWNSTTVPSTKQQAFIDLESRGWSLVPPEVFQVPDTELLNPCRSSHIQEVLQNAS